MMRDGSEISPRVGTLVTDFDGTLTRSDFYRLVIENLLPEGTPDYWGEYLAGRLTHFESLQRTFAAARSDEPALVRLVGKMGLAEGLCEHVASLRSARWDVVVASAGCEWYIHRLLGEAQVSMEVHANHGRIEDGRLVLQLPTESPFFSPSTGINKAEVVRAAIAEGGLVAFAGDGPPDLEPACLVPEEFRFARGFLAEELTRLKIPFQPFARWGEIAEMLLA